MKDLERFNSVCLPVIGQQYVWQGVKKAPTRFATVIKIIACDRGIDIVVAHEGKFFKDTYALATFWKQYTGTKVYYNRDLSL